MTTTSQRPNRPHLTVVGGGLAGCEAAWQAARHGADVVLYEMRPRVPTPAHRTADLAELVCSNSLGSDLPDRASGLLKRELRRMGSLVLECADGAAVPGGGALAVDRDAFAKRVTRAIERNPRIRVVRAEVREIPDGTVVVASGPLTSDALADALAGLTGRGHLYFFDAIAPIVTADSIDMSVAYRQSRYRGRECPGEGDYLNCPLDRDAFGRFHSALVTAAQTELRGFEASDPRFFEGCLPIEVLARRGPRALLYGPMRPVGLHDPRTGKGAYAVVQLRQDNAAGTLYNLVGFQTNLRWADQERVMRLIPGLERAEFVRLGQMHRNTYVNAPAVIAPTLALRERPDVILAGQIAGVEGYAGNIATGLVAGLNAARAIAGADSLVWPDTTMIGALCAYLHRADPDTFQPMKANFGLMPPLPRAPRQRAERHQAFAARSAKALEDFASSMLPGDRPGAAKRCT